MVSPDSDSKSDTLDGYCHCPAKIVPHRHLRPATDASVVQAIVGLPMRLKAHRAACSLSLREVARQTGVAASTLMRIEHGEDYTVDSLLAVAAYLDAGR
jgi:DNA-binding XRE family transcriptional regulator